MPIKKIIVVDDSATARQFLTDALGMGGYEVVTAENGD